MNIELTHFRESWLCRAAEKLAVMLKAVEAYMPPKVRYSVGFPRRGGSKAIGQCWSAIASKDETFEIFISPALDDPPRVLDVLLHEMIHAAVGLECRHRGEFRRVAKAVGLQGKMTATVAGAELRAELVKLAEELGKYPHAELHGGLSNAPPKQTTRQRKVKCPNDECGYTIRVTAKWIDKGFPICPCGQKMGEA